MKITAIETFRATEFANLLWVHIHTDAGTIGLGETFYGAAAVEDMTMTRCLDLDGSS